MTKRASTQYTSREKQQRTPGVASAAPGLKFAVGHLAIAVCTVLEGERRVAASRVKILPAGEFKGLNGEPKEVSCWRITDENGRRIAAAINSRNTDIVIDYDHQTLYASRTGVKAVASAWFKQAEWIDGDGLYATDTAWTAAARTHIEADEFRYISPVFSYDKKTGDVDRLINAALTNTPNLDNMADVAALAIQSITTTEEKNMDLDALLEQLRWLLNLPLSAGVEEVSTELQKLQDKIKSSATAAASQTFDLAAFLDKANEAIATNSATPDPTQYVPIADLTAVQTELNNLRVSVNSQRVEDLIKPHLESGALLPVQEAWARDLGMKDIAALSQFCGTLRAPAALQGMQTAGAIPQAAASAGSLSAEDLAVCSQMGIDKEEFAKSKSGN